MGSYIHDTYPSNNTNQDHNLYINAGGGGGLIKGDNLLVDPMPDAWYLAQNAVVADYGHGAAGLVAPASCG